MPVVEWNYTFLLGIKEIDQHHQRLVELLNKAYEEFKVGATVENMQSVIDQLVDYSAYHFDCEERWMADVSYHSLAKHKEEHAIFTSRILEFQNTLRQNGNVSLELVSFLSNWVTHHILTTDAELGRFVELQSIRRKVSKKLSKPVK